MGAHLAIGGGLFYGIQKFSEEIEDKLNDDTKFEIAIWLASVHVSDRIPNWPATFAAVFDHVFGKNHLSVRCFLRSCAASLALFLLSYSVFLAPRMNHIEAVTLGIYFTMYGVFSNLLPDYISLLETRLVLHAMSLSPNSYRWLLLLIADGAFTYLFSALCVYLIIGFGTLIGLRHNFSGALFQLTTETSYVWRAPVDKYFRVFCVPAFFTSIWLWLYAAGGFAIRFARRFDSVWSWASKSFDIEHKPLQCVGLISGTMAAVGYWAAALFFVMKK